MAKRAGEGRWRVVGAEFEKSATGLADMPGPDLAEVAVAGRSNVGKSSLFNAFVGHKGLARVSRTPGRTQLLNCFRLRLRGPEEQNVGLRWVDLPGYGFTRAPLDVRASFGPMIEGYLAGRATIVVLVLLVDARRGPVDADLQLLEFMAAHAKPTVVCATKVDKLGASERGLVAARMAAALGVASRDVLMTSASSGIGLSDRPRERGLARTLAELAAPR